MLARPLLADPQWPNKAYAGRVNEICPCIGDQEACLHEIVEGGHVKCAVNPRTGFEDVLGADVSLALAPRRIGVVGAGPAGIQAAVTASRRGHHVTLYDAHGRLGGWLIAGSVPKTKYEIANYLSYLEARVQHCSAEHGLVVRLGEAVTSESLKRERFDALVVCSGARPVTPDVPGTDLPHVVQAVDLLLDPGRAQGASEIVVVGGGAVGCEVAHWLAAEHGKRVTVIEMLPYVMKGLCTANRGHLIHELERRGARLLNCTRLQAIRPGEVTIARNRSASVPDPYVTWAPILPENVRNPLAKPIVEEFVEETLPRRPRRPGSRLAAGPFAVRGLPGIACGRRDRSDRRQLPCRGGVSGRARRIRRRSFAVARRGRPTAARMVVQLTRSGDWPPSDLRSVAFVPGNRPVSLCWRKAWTKARESGSPSPRPRSGRCAIASLPAERLLHASADRTYGADRESALPPSRLPRGQTACTPTRTSNSTAAWACALDFSPVIRKNFVHGSCSVMGVWFCNCGRQCAPY